MKIQSNNPFGLDASWVSFWQGLNPKLRDQIRAKRDTEGLSTVDAIQKHWPHLFNGVGMTYNPQTGYYEEQR
jgi:hypothetical protein